MWASGRALTAHTSNTHANARAHAHAHTRAHHTRTHTRTHTHALLPARAQVDMAEVRKLSQQQRSVASGLKGASTPSNVASSDLPQARGLASVGDGLHGGCLACAGAGLWGACAGDPWGGAVR